jgi:hypothetical protein
MVNAGMVVFVFYNEVPLGARKIGWESVVGMN